MSLPTVFVCGATGVQGGALARDLISKGVTVHALTRDLTSAKTQDLSSLGVKFWPGNFDNEEALKSAIAGCTSIFLNFYPDLTDMSTNLRQAKLIMSVALAAGVQHVVYTSGLGAKGPERMDGWDPKSIVAPVLGSKRDIEQAVQTAGFKYWTILRPGMFMVNFIAPYVAQHGDFSRTGVLASALKEDTPIPVVSPETIGAFSSAAILDAERFHGREIDYADEVLTPEVILQKLSNASGKTLKSHYYTDEEIDEAKSTNPFVDGQLITRELWKCIDMEEAKNQGVPLSTFDKFLEKEKARVVETYAQAP
ncbi:unnamed protein product [Cyclocybe aegerita]|uniref:NmrA-like domain-containing protein n=1 Tax=Cyclocybe aegerita TaxID=1973307 RepID=A0A8S0W0U7_CYCAE|nr:unnamed protein product [Cyclocybe aegerita]